MMPDQRFLRQKPNFWANVRTISQEVGYTEKGQSGQSEIKVPKLGAIRNAFGAVGLGDKHIVDSTGAPTELALNLIAYFEYRANILNSYVQPRLMDADRARDVFERLRRDYDPTCPLPFNKQKGAKKAPAYLSLSSTWCGSWEGR